MKQTRNLLAFGLCALALGAGLLACFVQSANHARAQELARLQRQCEMLEAANAQVKALVDAHLHGIPNGVEQRATVRERVRE